MKPKKKQLRDSTEIETYFGGLMEDMNDKFEAILESTKPIPKMQEQINHMLTWEENVNLIPAIVKQVGVLTKDGREAKQQISTLVKDSQEAKQQISTLVKDSQETKVGISKLKEQMNQVLSWEENINLIPTIFEEVGSLRQEIEILKKALRLLGRQEPQLVLMEKRLRQVEEKVATKL
ncbi:MAG: hypothetical protein HYZ63_02385 [Candidatus Andersenbacteria bacterium]|nr:hypothetical protein [Candidatus Andersenbacteria bacterium]